LKGYGVGRKNTNKIDDIENLKRFDVMTNFIHYKIPIPEIVVMDNAHSALNTKRGPLFDAIVCDPPYGVRARS